MTGVRIRIHGFWGTFSRGSDLGPTIRFVTVEITSSGLYLPEADVWLDPPTKQAFAFISHAHSDHARACHGHVLCTPPTAQACQRRLGVFETTELAYGESTERNGCRLTLYPAGHVLGSAQLLVERDGRRLVYTGDFKLGQSLTCRRATVVPTDTLILESTFALPIFRFPSVEKSRREIVRFARSSLSQGCTPVLLGYSFGKGPEIVKILDEAGIPTMLHESIYEMLEVYVAAGVTFAGSVPFDPTLHATHAVVIPPTAKRDRLLQNIPNPRVACVSGFAALDRTYDRTNVDACICLSDHADWYGLLRYVETVLPAKVYVTHGHCDALAGELRRRGFDAQAVHIPNRDGANGAC